MKLTIDTDARTLDVDGGETLPLYSDAAFKVLSEQWVNVGWVQKHCYTFSWLGRPVIQLPDDMIRMQELICAVRPTVIVETGVAHGGGLVFMASIARMLGLETKVIGVDVEVRPHNLAALDAHPLRPMIDLVIGSSTDEGVLAAVRERIGPDDVVMVVLDADHSYGHVSAELRAYAPMVSLGSYIVSTDGVMRQLAGLPRAGADWATDNPANANEDFAAANSAFEIVEPEWPFNESTLDFRVTHWPKCFLKRVRAD